jgi:hypothetical protein
VSEAALTSVRGFALRQFIFAIGRVGKHRAQTHICERYSCRIG